MAGGWHLSDETKKKMSEARRGPKSYLWGKHLSEETKKKLSEALRWPLRRSQMKNKNKERRSCARRRFEKGR